jgi:hypothetical protein
MSLIWGHLILCKGRLCEHSLHHDVYGHRQHIRPLLRFDLFYPLVVFSLLNMERTWTNILLLVSGLLILIGMNGTAHIHSHQVGLRYLTFVYPLFLFLPERFNGTSQTKCCSLFR